MSSALTTGSRMIAPRGKGAGWRPGGLRLRLALGASLLVVAVSFSAAALISRVARSELTNEYESTMRSLAENLSRNAAYGVFIQSSEVLLDLGENLLHEPDVREVVIRDNSNSEKPLLDRTKDGPSDGEILQVKVDVRYGSDARDVEMLAPFVAAKSEPMKPKVIGNVTVVYSRARLDSALARVQFRVWLAAMGVALFGTMVAIYLAGLIIEPLQTLSGATAAVAAGDFETKVAEHGGNEIAALARSFNRMIDALKVSRAKLAESYAELARKERLATLGQFTAVIAHELRNPLGVILSSAQVITNPRRTPEMKERAASFIVEEVRRLNTDLTSFLGFARPKTPEVRPASLAALAGRAVDAFRGAPGATAAGERPTPIPPDAHPDAMVPGGVMAKVIDEGAPAALVDPDQVHQLLLNLLFNAAQALATSGPAKEGALIEVIVRPMEGRAALIVADNGPGISDEVKARLFEPFFTTKKRGSGLGLAVVEQIVRAHHGELRLDSTPGQGARFTILFPSAGSLPAEDIGTNPARSNVP